MWYRIHVVCRPYVIAVFESYFKTNSGIRNELCGETPQAVLLDMS